MTELLEKLLPVLMLLSVGMFVRRFKWLSEEVIEGLKTIVVKIALPVILFSSFATVSLEASYLILFLLIFLFCSLLYGAGELLNRLVPGLFPKKFTGGYMTGFEFGMIGVGLFGAIWGMDKLPIIMLIGFGHELFIWFVYVPLISGKGDQKFELVATVIEFIKTPTIIGIGLGVVFNVFGLYEVVGQNLLGSSVYRTIDFLKPLTTPLILIVIGYAMSFGKVNVKDTLVYIVARWVLVLGIGIPLLFLIKNLVSPLDPIFEVAYFAFILLPAPYILPLFIEDDEYEFFSQLLVYSTMTSFVGYVILVALT